MAPQIDRALRFDTGAPWLDMLATVGNAYGPAPVERVPGVTELAAWFDHHDLTPVRPLAAEDVVRFHRLREALRPIVLAVLAGRPVTAVDALQPWLDSDEPIRVEVRAGRPGPAPPPTVDAALARVARQAVEALPQAALRACADPDCAMAYLDAGGRRRWCSPERCGVRARVRAHRARAREATPSDPFRARSTRLTP